MKKTFHLNSSLSGSAQTFLSRQPLKESCKPDLAILSIASDRIRESVLGTPTNLQGASHLDVFYKEYAMMLSGSLSETKFMTLFDLALKNEKLDFFLEALKAVGTYEKISPVIIPLLEKNQVNSVRSYRFMCFFLKVVLNHKILSSLNVPQLRALLDVVSFFQINTDYAVFSGKELEDVYALLIHSVSEDIRPKVLDLALSSLNYSNPTLFFNIANHPKAFLLRGEDLNRISEKFHERYSYSIHPSQIGYLRLVETIGKGIWEGLFQCRNCGFVKELLFSLIEECSNEDMYTSESQHLLDGILIQPSMQLLKKADLKDVLLAALDSRSRYVEDLFEKIIPYLQRFHKGNMKEKFKSIILESMQHEAPELCLQFLKCKNTLLFSKEDVKEVSHLFEEKYGISLSGYELPFFDVEFTKLDENPRSDVWSKVDKCKNIQFLKSLLLGQVKECSSVDINSPLKRPDIFYDKIFSHPKIQDLSLADLDDILISASKHGLFCREAVLSALSKSTYARAFFKKIRTLRYLPTELVNAIYSKCLQNNAANGLSCEEIRRLSLECRDPHKRLSHKTKRSFYRSLSVELLKRTAEMEDGFLTSVFQEALEYEIQDPLFILLQSPLAKKLPVSDLQFFLGEFERKYQETPPQDLDLELFVACEEGNLHAFKNRLEALSFSEMPKSSLKRLILTVLRVKERLAYGSNSETFRGIYSELVKSMSFASLDQSDILELLEKTHSSPLISSLMQAIHQSPHLEGLYENILSLTKSILDDVDSFSHENKSSSLVFIYNLLSLLLGHYKELSIDHANETKSIIETLHEKGFFSKETRTFLLEMMESIK
jgi:hypothetical protein